MGFDILRMRQTQGIAKIPHTDNLYEAQNLGTTTFTLSIEDILNIVLEVLREQRDILEKDSELVQAPSIYSETEGPHDPREEAPTVGKT